MSVSVKAYAKLNLTLAVTGLAGGFHMLDSLVCTVDMFDLIKLRKRADGEVTVKMHGMGCELLPPESNNAYKAAKAYIQRFKTDGADIEIYKNIPVGAGMGGSSADAAGVLRGMSKLYGFGGDGQLKELADSLGSDTGYMLTGGYARLKGRGDIVEKLDFDERLNILMLLPKNGVSTAECYRLCDEYPKMSLTSDMAINALEDGDKPSLGKSLFNALYAPAIRLNGDIKLAYEELKSFSPSGVNMTGSGSGVFAVFESAELCAWAKSRYRGKFECLQLKTVIPKN